MAKEMKNVPVKGKLTFVHASELFGFVEKNYARDDFAVDTEKEQNEKAVLLHSGWWENEPIFVNEMTIEEQATALERLEKQREALERNKVDSEPYMTHDAGKKGVTLVPAEELRGWDELHMHGGKVIKPKYDIWHSFQRVRALYKAFALRVKQGMSNAEFNIPVIIMAKDYSAQDRLDKCTLENFGKDQGRNDVTVHWPTLVKIGIRLRNLLKEQGKVPKEADYTRTIAGISSESKLRGSAQKTCSICMLDARFPKLEIAKKCMAVDGNAYAKGLDREKLRTLRDKDEESVVAYFADPTKKPEPKMPNKSDIIARANSTPNQFVRFLLLAVADYGDMKLIDKLETEEIADECNELLKKAGIKIKTREQLAKDIAEAAARAEGK